MLSEALCLTCGYRFTFDAEYFTARGLRVPKHCRRCRAEKRTTNGTSAPSLSGTVVRAGAAFAFVETAEGQQFFAHRSNVRAPDWPLRRGDTVTFTPAMDVHDYDRTDRLPRAYAVCREGARSSSPGACASLEHETRQLRERCRMAERRAQAAED